MNDKEITSVTVYIMAENINTYDKMIDVLKTGFNNVSLFSNSISFICDNALIFVKEGKGYTYFSSSLGLSEKDAQDILDKLLKVSNNYFSFAVLYNEQHIENILVTEKEPYNEYLKNIIPDMAKEHFTLEEMAQYIAFSYKREHIK